LWRIARARGGSPREDGTTVEETSVGIASMDETYRIRDIDEPCTSIGVVVGMGMTLGIVNVNMGIG